MQLCFIFYVLSVFCASGVSMGLSGQSSALPSWIERPKAVGWDAKASAMAQMACRKGKTVLRLTTKSPSSIRSPASYSQTRPNNNQHNPSKWNGTIDREATALKATHRRFRCRWNKNVVSRLYYYVAILITEPIYLKQLTPRIKHLFASSLSVRFKTQIFVQHPSGKIDRQSIQIDNGNLSFAINGGDWPKATISLGLDKQRRNPKFVGGASPTKNGCPTLGHACVMKSWVKPTGAQHEDRKYDCSTASTALSQAHVSPQLRKVAQIRAEALSRLHGIRLYTPIIKHQIKH